MRCHLLGLMLVAEQLLPPRAYITRCRVHQVDKHQGQKPGGFFMRFTTGHFFKPL